MDADKEAEQAHSILAEFLEAHNRIAQRHFGALKKARIAAFGTDDPLKRAFEAWAIAMRGEKQPVIDVGAHYDHEGFRDDIIELLKSGDALAKLADRWGFDNTPVLNYLHSTSDAYRSSFPPALHVLIERMSVRAENIGATKEITDSTVTPVSQSRPRLSGTAAIVYELLKAQPPHKAMLGPAIVDALEARHRIVIDDSTLRKNIFPKLEPWGLQHKKKVGYWIEDSA